MHRSAIPVMAAAAITLALPAYRSEPATAHTAHPVTVNRCSPERSPGSAGGYVGYAPAFYPPGRYIWNDPFARSYYQPPISPSGTLYIDYKNATEHEMKTIEFGLVARGHLVEEVRDVGKFSPGVEIKHSFGISPNVFPLRTALPACVPLRIEYADGRRWINPRLPRSDDSLYR